MANTEHMPTGSDVLGVPIPFLPHAISVSLPTWDDNAGYAGGEQRIVDTIATGYPRFFIHRDTQALAGICEMKFGQPGEKCFLFPSAYIADAFRQFMINHPSFPPSPIPVRLVEYAISAKGEDPLELHIALFQADEFSLSIGMQFWQRTGLGISSRFASVALNLLARNGEYTQTHKLQHGPKSENTDKPYGCKGDAMLAKATLRQRIAGLIIDDSPPTAEIRGITVSEHDVFLFPTGMAAIWTSHQLLLAVRPRLMSASFGFASADTMKMLILWGPGDHFFAGGQDAEIDQLESILQSKSISVLFTESTSNPLLRSVNLPRLRKLADQHDFLIVVDETIGSFANVQVLPYADIVVTSLSGFFSGKANVMGGSLVLNPRCKHYQTLKSQLENMYEDNYWWEDALAMESNSRDFISRMHAINQTTEFIADFLHAHSSTPSTVLKRVFYPKWETRAFYDMSRRTSSGTSGFSGLISLTFTTMAASQAFFDNLNCAKGPGLGTNFTLACPYTILMHYREQPLAEVCGVEPGLVRISVGIEDKEDLLGRVRAALDAAEATAH
ncbi:unnamed protein product [Rhizoctonia solani]|uniref:Cystathionine gamma-synthase n=1 Tax=Rhizoctonia solani TaxID=456999 RepID=A0A8H3HPR8_9AGAM|nr:unnamed protein product [Rhizoctonia solani]